VTRRPPVVVVALLAVILAGCASSIAPTEPPPTSGSGGGVPTDAALECAVTQPPGPADVPSTEGEMDTSDQGGGRWRLCLTTPAPISVETSAWCRWDADRTQVEDVSGLPAVVGTVAYDAFATRRGAFEIHLTDQAQGGLIANYEAGLANLRLSAPSDLTGGLLAFEATLVEDPESGPPAGAPPVVSGTLAWECGEPPPA